MFFFSIGMWSASFYIGNFIGPTASGFLVDAYGFQWTTTVFCSIYALTLITNIIELTFNMSKSRRNVHRGYEPFPEEK